VTQGTKSPQRLSGSTLDKQGWYFWWLVVTQPPLEGRRNLQATWNSLRVAPVFRTLLTNCFQIQKQFGRLSFELEDDDGVFFRRRHKLFPTKG